MAQWSPALVGRGNIPLTTGTRIQRIINLALPLEPLPLSAFADTFQPCRESGVTSRERPRRRTRCITLLPRRIHYQLGDRSNKRSYKTEKKNRNKNRTEERPCDTEKVPHREEKSVHKYPAEVDKPLRHATGKRPGGGARVAHLPILKHVPFIRTATHEVPEACGADPLLPLRSTNAQQQAV